MTGTNSPNAADEYRQKADDCRKLSERAPHPSHEERWLEIARRWERLAEIADRNARHIALET
jgi:hypothetical protein